MSDAWVKYRQLQGSWVLYWLHRLNLSSSSFHNNMLQVIKIRTYLKKTTKKEGKQVIRDIKYLGHKRHSSPYQMRSEAAAHMKVWPALVVPAARRWQPWRGSTRMGLIDGLVSCMASAAKVNALVSIWYTRLSFPAKIIYSKFWLALQAFISSREEKCTWKQSVAMPKGYIIAYQQWIKQHQQTSPRGSGGHW